MATTTAAVLLATVILLLEAEGGFCHPIGRPAAAVGATAAAAAASAARGRSDASPWAVRPFHAATAADRDGDALAPPPFRRRRPFASEAATDVVVRLTAPAHAPTDGEVANGAASADGAAAADATPWTEPLVVIGAPAFADARPRARSSSSSGSKATSSSSGSKPSSSSSGNKPTSGNRPTSSPTYVTNNHYYDDNRHDRYDDGPRKQLPLYIGLPILGGVVVLVLVVVTCIVMKKKRAAGKEGGDEVETDMQEVDAGADYYYD